MSMTPKLVPTPIVDKNGKPTTVHKRADDVAGKRTAKVPAPAVSKAPEQASSRELMILTNSLAMSISAAGLGKKRERELMATLNENTLPMISTQIKDKQTDVRSFRSAIEWGIKSGSFAVLNNLVLLTGEDLSGETPVNFTYTPSVLMGMQKMREPGTPEIDLTDPGEERSEGARALLEALDYASDKNVLAHSRPTKGMDITTFHDPEAGTLIMDRPERALDIVDIYEERRSFDRELYENILDHGVPPLNDGML